MEELGDNQNQEKKTKDSYFNEESLSAIEKFGEISAWIVAPIIFAVLVGKSLDARYDTYPFIFLSLAVIGFLISMFGIIKTAKKMINK